MAEGADGDRGVHHMPHWTIGDPIKADDLNKVSDFSGNLQFQFQPPLYYRQLGNNIVVYLRNGNEGSEASAFPFKVYNRSTSTDPKIAVNALDGFVGQVNSVIPQIGGDDIGTDPTPLLTLVNITSSGVIYLNCAVDVDFNITGITVEEDTSIPADTSSNVYITIATINSLDAGPPPTFIIGQTIINSLTYQRCAEVNIFFGS